MAKKSPEIIQLEKQISDLRSAFDKELKAKDKRIKKLETDNSKLIKQIQINTRRLSVLKKKNIQNDLEHNKLESQIGSLKNSLNNSRSR